MRALICVWLAWMGATSAGVAYASPRAQTQAKYREASRLVTSGNVDQALALIEEGLAIAPQDVSLLGLKGRVLLALRDYPAALAAYEAYLRSGVAGANQRKAQQIVKSLGAVRTTFLAITLTNGPATIYLDSRTLGAFCVATPSCNKQILPGDYKVIVERPGFEVWTDQVTIAASTSTKLLITLAEKPSQLTIRVAQPGAQITIDGAAYDAPARVAAGTHHVVVSLAGHREGRYDAVAHEGQPVALEVALTPLTPVRVEPVGAALLLDGKPIAIEPGGLAIPPGEHALLARAKGFRDRRVQIAANRKADDELVIVLERVPPPPVVGAAPSQFTPRRKVALAAAGLGLAGLAGGVVLGLQSEALKNDAFLLCPSPSMPCTDASNANSDYQRGRTRALQADIGFRHRRRRRDRHRGPLAHRRAGVADGCHTPGRCSHRGPRHRELLTCATPRL